MFAKNFKKCIKIKTTCSTVCDICLYFAFSFRISFFNSSIRSWVTFFNTSSLTDGVGTCSVDDKESLESERSGRFLLQSNRNSNIV